VLLDSQLDIMSVEDVWDELLTAAQREPMESWMTWLHPAQSTLVTRTFNGPARIRGASGTGKSVVALHRARRLAREPEARVLVTSFVRSLPLVQQQLFDRMAPECGDRVEFLSLHKLASRISPSAGHHPHASPRREGAPPSGRPTARCPKDGPDAVVSAEDYWWTRSPRHPRPRAHTVEEYSTSTGGRRTPLRESGRRAMWAIHEEYRRRLEARGEADWADPIETALASVRETPLEPAFTSVIVDEVQDISCQGLRLLHALVGDREDGLLLVGDGQQRVYVGGCTLSEAGITVPGPRSISLDVNYRNTAEVLDAALEVISGDEFDDLDGDPAPGQREVTTQRAGGQVLQVTAPRDEDHATALISALLAAQTQGVRVGEMAVLVRTNREADTWVATLIDHGCPAELLADYDGRPTDAVKVGTYQRAKGLEFACVFVPHRDRAVPPPRDDETDDAYRERAEMQRRQLFVAMTRARDRLWLGTVTPTMRSPHEE
jgi:superfamily I DNA/RNA helicase